jgi:hypothetical protein
MLIGTLYQALQRGAYWKKEPDVFGFVYIDDMFEIQPTDLIVVLGQSEYSYKAICKYGICHIRKNASKRWLQVV